MQRVGRYRERADGTPIGFGPVDVLRPIDDYIHRGFGPEDILVTVAGGDAGAHSAFIPSWSQSRGSIMQSKPIGVCLDCD